MSEKQGYPDPNYTEEDIVEGVLEEALLIPVEQSRYDYMIACETLLMLLRNDYKKHYRVDEKITLAAIELLNSMNDKEEE